MQTIVNSTRKIIIRRKFSAQLQSFKPLDFFDQQTNVSNSSHPKIPPSKLGKQIINDLALDETTRSTLLKSIRRSQDFGLSEELEQQLDKVTGSRNHETSRYNSYSPNERSSNSSAFYEPSIYNIEEMDTVYATEQCSGNKSVAFGKTNDQRRSSD